MKIGGLQKLTLIDYPGRVAATVFLMGCNFRCPFCYSSEIVLPEKIKDQPQLSQEYFFDFLKKRKNFLEGVVICGGEPTINKDLPLFAAKIKKMGFLVKLDTNGSNPEMLEELINEKCIDYVAMDIKAPKEKYPEAIGVSGPQAEVIVESIEKSIVVLKESDVDFEFRTTVVPNFLEKKEVVNIAKWVGPAPKYFLQNFKAEKTLDPRFEQIKPYPQEYLLEIKEAVASFFDTCRVR